MTLVFVSRDLTKLPVAKEAALLSNVVASMLDDEQCDDNEVPVSNVSDAVLRKVVDFLEYHAHSPMSRLPRPLPDTDLTKCVSPSWYASFALALDADTIQEVAMAANFLDIPPLLDLACATIATTLKDKTVEELCAFFSLPLPVSQ